MRLATHLPLAHTAAALLLALAVLATGCLGRSPEAAFYTLTAPAPPSAEARAAGPALDVGPVRLPRYLERSEIVTQEEGGRVRVHEFHRWAVGLERELGRVLGLDLARHLGSERVSVYPARPAWPVDARVAVEIDRLDARPGDAVELEGRFTLVGPGAPAGADASGPGEAGEKGDATELDAGARAPGGTRLLAARRLVLREPVEGDDMGALVAAHSRLADALAREIAAAVREAGL